MNTRHIVTQSFFIYATLITKYIIALRKKDEGNCSVEFSLAHKNLFSINAINDTVFKFLILQNK